MYADDVEKDNNMPQRNYLDNTILLQCRNDKIANMPLFNE